MRTRARGASLLAWVLVVQVALPAAPARAASDKSTLAVDRGIQSNAAALDASAASDLFTGSAVHRIPIVAPPGTGGLTPDIALAYSSSGPADSWVGVGWSLGPPSIWRSLKRGVPAYDDEADLFDFGGQELVPEALTALPRSYHTRRETFVRIVHETANSWTVTQKNGVALRFGLTANARIEKAPGQVFEWLLSEQEDPHGNVITYSYDREDSGTAYLTEIRYTLRRQPGGGLASIDGDSARDRIISFILETTERPDVSETYAPGFLRRLAHRLQSIEVRVGASLIRRYQPVYLTSADTFRSLLDRIELFGTDNGALKPPFVTKFSYHSNVAAGTTGWEASTWAWPAGLSLVNADRSDGGVRLGDVDGDGLVDLIKSFADTNLSAQTSTLSTDSGVYLNTGTGFSASPSAQWTIPTFSGPDSLLIPFFAHRLTGPGTPNEIWGTGRIPIDLTGDGRVDIAAGDIALCPDNVEEVPLCEPGSLVENPAFRSSWWESTASGWVEHRPADLPSEDPQFSTSRFGY